MENPINMDNWGYHYFRKPPYGLDSLNPFGGFPTIFAYDLRGLTSVPVLSWWSFQVALEQRSYWSPPQVLFSIGTSFSCWWIPHEPSLFAMVCGKTTLDVFLGEPQQNPKITHVMYLFVCLFVLFCFVFVFCLLACLLVCLLVCLFVCLFVFGRTFLGRKLFCLLQEMKD